MIEKNPELNPRDKESQDKLIQNAKEKILSRLKKIRKNK